MSFSSPFSDFGYRVSGSGILRPLVLGLVALGLFVWGWFSSFSYALWGLSVLVSLLFLVDLDGYLHRVDDYLLDSGYVGWYYIPLKYGNPLRREPLDAYFVSARGPDGREHNFLLISRFDGLYRRDG